MGLFDAAKQELERKHRQAVLDAQLKFHYPDAPFYESAERDAHRLEIAGYVASGFDMVMNGFQTAERVHDTIELIRSTKLMAEVAEETEAVSTAVKGAERFMFALEALGPLVSYVGFWMDLAGAWAEAKARILKDNLLRGLSYGVVLGANDAGASYVRNNFWQWGKLSYPAYREVEEAAKNLHNIALCSGYGQAKALTKNQKGRVFADILRRMSDATRSFYFPSGDMGDWKDWGLSLKKSYYGECAAIFRREHLS